MQAKRSEAGIIWVLWLTYGAFYFCRSNLSAALPGIESELGYSKTQLGAILGALKLAYGVGQLLNGQLAERYSPRLLLALGMFGSAALNLIFGWATGLYFMLFVWACNGYFQALGWTPCMRVAANWFPLERRGKAVGIIGTGYQTTAVLTFLIAGWAAQTYGWRGALYIPAGLLALSAVHMLLFLRETPGATGPQRQTEGAPASAVDPSQGRGNVRFTETLLITLSNPSLWLLALSLGLLNACRYGFLDWGVSHLKEIQQTGVASAAFKYAVLPAGGVIGAYFSGWATDRFLEGRRAPMICSLLACLGVLTLVYDRVVLSGFEQTIGVLFLVGFCIYGAQVLLVGTAPMDLARHGTPAAAVGFVNFMGYMGAFVGDQLTGHLVDSQGWQMAVMTWAGFAFGAAAVSGLLWNTTGKSSPKLKPNPLPGKQEA